MLLGWAITAGAVPAATAGYPPHIHRRSDAPHPAVARIVVPEGGATSYGSGVLVDVRKDFGLVITNWHVVRDAAGTVEVMMPGGFTSKARPLKVDPDWDLAALVIWRPPTAPVEIAAQAPQPGDELTICGYGPGIYRAATGRCTQYYSPRQDLPQQMVELDVEARLGDSGGPIFNDRGELAGVLFGAGQGTTLGSFGGRVENFLASLAPDIGRGNGDAAEPRTAFALVAAHASEPLEAADAPPTATLRGSEAVTVQVAAAGRQDAAGIASQPAAVGIPSETGSSPAAAPLPGSRNALDLVKSALAAVGVIAIAAQLLKMVK